MLRSQEWIAKNSIFDPDAIRAFKLKGKEIHQMTPEIRRLYLYCANLIENKYTLDQFKSKLYNGKDEKP